ncbi:uncharacterized protein VICG_02032 [Vittaforma corneae ATCC 50505]|uniref:Uncharacterized protein n=1 Tax=Vittaforma corneae (strain ATCC 50505) TaxID=993615 RepID=L2GJ89_VITCO|nr:uncharacterized protein VICG_02032 [Vittaforma corneae ATCC 50505]ELA40943.1 hypothetical protein VICG_02032 [Vittaforma corneae ATCC 50505]
MYENLIAFLLGRKTELTEEDLNDFMELLVKALNVEEEYETLEKQTVIENIVDSVAIKDQNERKIISSAIENILELEEESTDTEESEDIFADKSEDAVPLKMRKMKRGDFGRAKTEKDKRKSKKEAKANDGNKMEAEADKNNGSIVVDKKIEENQKKAKVNEEKEIKPSQIFVKDNIANATLNYPQFDFEIGELEENHQSGPEFSFRLDE